MPSLKARSCLSHVIVVTSSPWNLHFAPVVYVVVLTLALILKLHKVRCENASVHYNLQYLRAGGMFVRVYVCVCCLSRETSRENNCVRYIVCENNILLKLMGGSCSESFNRLQFIRRKYNLLLFKTGDFKNVKTTGRKYSLRISTRLQSWTIQTSHSANAGNVLWAECRFVRRVRGF